MPIRNGEKWACNSCIKGHRVSGCTHEDRPLFHINPKGRPVKQCEHCRGARKSKSHHAKCDCGDKKDKEKHKDKGDAKGEQLASVDAEQAPNQAAVHESHCGCHSGAKCLCGVKMEGLDLELDTSKQTLHAARARPKVVTAHSESTLTIFANGHHQPCHRRNNTAHISGAPYKLSRPHTLHGAASFANVSHDNAVGTADIPAQRSMDTLSVSNDDFYTIFGSAQRPLDGLPMTPLNGSFDNGVFQDALFTAYGQDSNSPAEDQISDATASQQWPWTSITPLSGTFGLGSLSTSPSQDCLPNLDSDWGIPSAGLSNPSWSAGDLPLDPAKFTDSYTQPISHSGESNNNPGLTTGSSAHSEGEHTLFDNIEINNPPSVVSDSLFWEDNPVFQLPASSATKFQSALASTAAYAQDFQPKQSDAMLARTPNSNLGNIVTSYSVADFNETAAIPIPDGLNDIVSNDPWSTEPNSATFGELGGLDLNNYPGWL